jgi:ubiquinone/menaquinone biosynthesis C-methylase UbiE
MIGFEYKNKNGKTPFETFLQYTDQKQKSAAKLAAILKEKLQNGAHVLDIGTGNGEYLDLILSDINIPSEMKLTLVEPSDDLMRQLKIRFEERFPSIAPRFISADLESFNSAEEFDVILMSHLFYHIPRTAWAEQLAKALSLLKQNGVLVIVLREKDDTYEFKSVFKPRLFNASFKALTIDVVLGSLPKKPELRITKYIATSELKIPVKDKFDDAVSIIEFLLNKEWGEIPPHIQQSSMDFIKDKGAVFKQLDGIALIEKQGGSPPRTSFGTMYG